MPVYILKEGTSNVFKIGRTKGDVAAVLKRLQTGNSKPLSHFDTVEADQESACEAFFHRRLVSRRVGGGGGWEFFRMDSDEHMYATVEEFRVMAKTLEEAEEAISPFDHEQCSAELVDPTDEDRELLVRLLKIKEEQAYLKFECELIESQLKLRIGTTSGIRGVATWKTELRFDEECFKTGDPEAYQTILEQFPCIDTTAWKSKFLQDYETARSRYFSRSRKFLTNKTN